MFQLERTDLVERVTLAAAVALALATLPDPTTKGWMVLVPLALALASAVLVRRPNWVTAGFLAIAPVSFAFPRYVGFAQATVGALLGGALLALALRLDAGRTPVSHVRLRLAALAATNAVVFLAGTAVLRRLQLGTTLADTVPPELLRALAGAATGSLIGLTTLAVFVKRAGDEVHAALAKLQVVRSETLRNLVQELVEARSKVLRAVESLPADDAVRREARRAADAVALAGIRLVDRFAVADRVLSSTPVTTLETRLSELDQQLATSADLGVQRDLTRARDVTADQLAQVRTLEKARERLAARLQAEVAALRRNETSLALLASADAAVAALELEAIGSGLSRRAVDLAAEGAELHAAMASAPVRSVVARA